MLKVNTYTIKGTKTGEFALPKEFDQKVNPNLLAQAVRVYEERSHVGLRKTKTRSEVNRTTKKLYKQKGTGGARHGSRRAPIFVGGGVALGPRPIRRILTLPDKLKSKSRMSALAAKIGEKELILVSGLSKVDKTKIVSEFIKKLAKETGAKRFTFLFSEKNQPVFKFLRKLSGVNAVLYRDVNAFDVFYGGTIVMDADIFENKKIKK